MVDGFASMRLDSDESIGFPPTRRLESAPSSGDSSEQSLNAKAAADV
jgi:hypothetical protein